MNARSVDTIGLTQSAAARANGSQPGDSGVIFWSDVRQNSYWVSPVPSLWRQGDGP